jgi:hypothetical protein
MKIFGILFFTTLSMTLSAQVGFNSSNLNVTQEDLIINSYDRDSTANALVLYEYGNSYFRKESFFLVTEIKRKIKILNKDGLNFANIEIPIYISGGKEDVKDIKGSTYNYSNGKTELSVLEDNQIFREAYNDKYSIIKFLLPNVKVGSVITYSYTVVSPYVNKYYGWDFQTDIPKLYSEYNASIPGNYEYHIRLIGNQPLDINQQDILNNCLDYGNASANCGIYKHAMSNIPAFIPEDFMTTPNNYRSRIEYELKTIKYFDGKVKQITETWESADKQLRSSQNFGVQLKINKSNTCHLPENILNEENLETKAKLVYKYIQENYKWNGINRNYDESVAKLLKEKSGTATEINMLLHNCLKDQGFDVHPILMSTRENGLPTKLYPVISEFNYLIVLLKTENEKFFLDGTNPYLAFGEIPFKCLNQYGRVIDLKSGSYWMDIEPKLPSTMQLKASLEFSDEKTISGNYYSASTGYNALTKKQSYYENRTSYIENLDNKLADITITNHNVVNSDKSSYDFIEESEIKWDLEEVGDNIYLNPILVSFYKSNPFKLQERTYPIDFGYKQAYLYNLNLKLNNLYTVKELPKEQTYNLPNNAGSIVFKIDQKDDEVNLYFRFNINGTLFNYEYYNYFKDYFGEIIDINNNSLIVLQKKQS